MKVLTTTPSLGTSEHFPRPGQGNTGSKNDLKISFNGLLFGPVYSHELIGEWGLSLTLKVCFIYTFMSSDQGAARVTVCVRNTI